MEAILKLPAAWPGLISRAFSEHTLAAAVVTIAAAGIFVILQKELRPYNLATNLVFVALGWLASISALVPVMAALRRAWMVLEDALPFAAKLSAYLLGICERHPIVALAIVGAGTTAYFLKQAWPMAVSWGPVRAACAIFGSALAIHIAGPIADLAAAESPAVRLPSARQFEKVFAEVPPQEAVARAIKAGDSRYVSVPKCVDDVPEVASPRTVPVKSLGPTCAESLGQEGGARMRKQNAYAAEYNRLMYKHHSALTTSLKDE